MVVGRVGWGDYLEKIAVLVEWVEFAQKKEHDICRGLLLFSPRPPPLPGTPRMKILPVKFLSYVTALRHIGTQQ